MICVKHQRGSAYHGISYRYDQQCQWLDPPSPWGHPVYRTFSVASPISARISEMIQNRITICGSAQPCFSK